MGNELNLFICPSLLTFLVVIKWTSARRAPSPLSCRSLQKFLNAWLATPGTALFHSGRAFNVTFAATCVRNASVGRTRSSVPTPPVNTKGSASPVTATLSSKVP